MAFYDDEPPRPGWAEILLLAERLAPAPALLPGESAARALVFGLGHEICGEEGLGWSRRLQLVHAGLHNAGGFPRPRRATWAGNTATGPTTGAACGARVVDLLGLLAARLKAQRLAGSRYYVGDAPKRRGYLQRDLHGAVRPLPAEHCTMDAGMRAAFDTRDAATEAALDPILFEHRGMMYREHLALPLSL